MNKHISILGFAMAGAMLRNEMADSGGATSGNSADAAPTPSAAPSVTTANGVITKALTFVLPASLEKRKEIAAALGFDEIGKIRDALKVPATADNAKAYAKNVKDAAEKVASQISYPDVTVLAVADVQEVVANLAATIARGNILNARRKNEELPLIQAFNVFDLQGGDEAEEDGEYDKDTVVAHLDAFVKERGFNETTSIIVTAGIVGTKGQMLKIRKFFPNMKNAQAKFAEWAADKAGDDFEAVAFWLKRQAKRLASAESTPEISESEVTI